MLTFIRLTGLVINPHQVAYATRAADTGEVIIHFAAPGGFAHPSGAPPAAADYATLTLSGRDAEKVWNELYVP